MMNETLPQPLVPADCDLRGLGFMPLEHASLIDSDFFIKSTGDEFKAAFALWCKSWSQIPAASLPDDDQVLEELSRSKVWKKVRDKALHGWLRCADGRLYHPVVAKHALEAWERRLEHQEVNDNKDTRQQRWRAKVKELSAKLRAAGITPPTNAKLADLERLLEMHVDALVSTSASTAASTSVSTGDAGETSTVDGRETALDRDRDRDRDSRARVPASAPAPGGVPACAHEATVEAGVLPAARLSMALRRGGFSTASSSDPRVIAVAEAGLTADEVEAAARDAVADGKGIAWALKAAQGRRLDAAKVSRLPPRRVNGSDDDPFAGAV